MRHYITSLRHIRDGCKKNVLKATPMKTYPKGGGIYPPEKIACRQSSRRRSFHTFAFNTVGRILYL